MQRRFRNGDADQNLMGRNYGETRTTRTDSGSSAEEAENVREELLELAGKSHFGDFRTVVDNNGHCAVTLGGNADNRQAAAGRAGCRIRAGVVPSAVAVSIPPALAVSMSMTVTVPLGGSGGRTAACAQSICRVI